MNAYFRYRLRSFPQIGTSLRPRLGEEILDKAHADVVPHLIQMLVDFYIVAIKVGAKLGHHRAIGQGDELGIDLVYSCSGVVSDVL